MDFSPSALKPTKKNFYKSAAMGLALSICMILNPETDDGLILAYWVLLGSITYCCIGLFILFGGAARDSVFGFTICPHCKKYGWDIKQKLKITSNKNTSIGKCSYCQKGGIVKFYYTLPMLIIFLSWVPIIGITDSISITSFTTYILFIVYLFYYARYVPIQ